MGKPSYITYFKRLAVIAVLIVLFLEAGLRAEGRLRVIVREHRNRQAVRLKGDYRIMCLGESTTEHQYPRFLEEALNQRGFGVRFSVIDKGNAAFSSSDIAGNAEAYLDEYRPDLVVSMMGINDRDVSLQYGASAQSKIIGFISSMRTYKLARLLWLRILGNTGEKPSRESSIKENSLKRNIATDPRDDNAYWELGRFYHVNHRFSKAEETYKKALEINPYNDKICSELGRVYADRRNFSRAGALFSKALSLNRRNHLAYIGLGVIYREHGNYRQAEALFKKGKALDPSDDNAYFELAMLYYGRGELSRAAEMFRRVIQVNPQNTLVYVELGWVYLDQRKYAEAEEVLKQGIEVHPDDDRLYGALVLLYEKTGRQEEAREHARELQHMRSAYYLPVTVANYRALKNILDGRGVRLVCVQYPMRRAGPLRKIFEGEEGVIVVDNEEVFQKAVAKEGFKAVFTDMFAGDFGHCTEHGNRLLAGNIADAIIENVFNK